LRTNIKQKIRFLSQNTHFNKILTFAKDLANLPGENQKIDPYYVKEYPYYVKEEGCPYYVKEGMSRCPDVHSVKEEAKKKRASYFNSLTLGR